MHYFQFKFTIIYLLFSFSQMLKRKVNITYNTAESIHFVLQSNDEDIDEVVDNNDSSDSSEYEEDKNKDVTLI